LEAFEFGNDLVDLDIHHDAVSAIGERSPRRTCLF
jgi:hypothetical protein